MSRQKAANVVPVEDGVQCPGCLGTPDLETRPDLLSWQIAVSAVQDASVHLIWSPRQSQREFGGKNPLCVFCYDKEYQAARSHRIYIC